MSPLSRRELVKRSTLTAAALHLSPYLAAAPASAAEDAPKGRDALPVSADTADLVWLDGAAPPEVTGATWGVAWPRGAHTKSTPFALQNASGAAVPVQTWSLAYWPDGSLKWTAHAIGAGETPTAPLRLIAGTAPAAPTAQVVVHETPEHIDVDTGVIQCRIGRQGNAIIASIARGGREIASGVHLVGLRRDAPEQEETAPGARQERFLSAVTSATVEQSGPVRTVVRLDGKHTREGKSGRPWLPFTVRLYFYAGAESVRLLHTFVFDGDPSHDFISGLGIRFGVPLSDPLTDRHVRFVGENGGLWGEAVRTLTGLRRDPGASVRAAQIAGQATPPADQLPANVGGRLDLIPSWGDFTLTQPNADGFEIRKRTKGGHGWIRAGAGRRAAGLGYVGGAAGGGVAFGLRDFWQRHPTQFDIRNAVTEKAEVTVWLWSPEAPPMDLRFYHDDMGMTDYVRQNQGLDITYEDFEPGWGTPYGIARTSEMMLYAVAATPPRERLVALAGTLDRPPLLACRPEHLHAAGVFSNWSLPDRSTAAKKAIEDQLDYLLDLYLRQAEQRRWYGFWDYGDVMHSYDGDRHEWRYDVGGFAWANSELSPDLWLWYSYLRSGRADIFRMAEAMTRHTSEVDIYHLGRFQGWGSRHNVQHWGDSSKQPRVSTAAFRRMFYFLTADERTGDILRDLCDADQRIPNIDIGRKLQASAATAASKPSRQVSAGFGTDWCSFAAAWLTEWERTGDTRWRDRIAAGMQTIGGLPRGWMAGGSKYDLDTGRFLGPGDTVGVSHLSAVFGAVEINAELISLIDVPEYEKTWVQYCEAYNAPPAERERLIGAKVKEHNLGEAHSRLTAYAAVRKSDPKLAERAWSEFFGGAAGLGVRKDLTLRHISGPAVLNPVDEGFGLSTNAASQWGLTAIENLALIGDHLSPDLPSSAETGGDAA